MKKVIKFLFVTACILMTFFLFWEISSCSNSLRSFFSPRLITAPPPTPTPRPTPRPTLPPPTPEPIDAEIGIVLPTKSLQRWRQDGENMKAGLEEVGFRVDLQYSDNDVNVQITQIENMITAGCDILIIASVDGSSLATVLELAKAQNISVIAYDRLILDTDAVSYYVTFDNVIVGTLQGEYIRDTLKLDEADGSFNIELITGDPGDSGHNYFLYGAMKVLQPYIDSGKLVVPSGQTSFEQTATANWSTENAQARFENIITASYANGKKMDAVMASNDSTAQGVTNALLAAGYTEDNFPIITGMDCDIQSVKNMLAGYQSMSVFKDTRTLAAKAVEMADAIVRGTEVPVNDTQTYDNNKGIVSSYLCAPVVVTVDNYEEYLIDSGYYTADQLEN